MSYKRPKNNDKITSDSIATDNQGTTLKTYLNNLVKIKQETPYPSSLDLNTVLENGVYGLDLNVPLVNSPTNTNSYKFLIVFSASKSGDNLVQMLVDCYNNKTYIRSRNWSSFNNWTALN